MEKIMAIIGITGAVFSGITAFFMHRRQSKTDAFKSIIEANEKFRNEVRMDLIKANERISLLSNENDKYRKEILELMMQIGAYKEQMGDLKSKLAEYEDLINDYKHKIQELTNRILSMESVGFSAE